MQMTPHQVRLWTRMLELVEAYMADRLALKPLIDSLEAAFHASEIPGDTPISQRFLSYWDALYAEQDIAEALGIPVDDQAIRDCVRGLQRFLKEALADQRGHSAS